LGLLLGSSSAVGVRQEFHPAGSAPICQTRARQGRELSAGVVQQLFGVSVTIGVACGLSFLVLSLVVLRFFLLSLIPLGQLLVQCFVTIPV